MIKLTYLNKIVFLIATLIVCGAKADNHNLTSNFIGNALGITNLEYSYKIADHLTLGIMGSNGKAKIDTLEIKGSAVGMIARYYLNPAFANNSWYLVSGVNKNNFEILKTDSGVDYTADFKETVVGAGAGYHWFWNSFNISFGVLMTNQSKTDLFDKNGNKYKDPFSQNVTIDFTMGGKF